MKNEEYKIKAALECGLKIIARREVCRAQMVGIISRKFDDDAGELVANKLCEMGLISDERYARALAEYLYGEKQFYIKRVEYELCKKGIDRDLAREVAHGLAPDPDNAIEKILGGRLGQNLDDSKQRNRVFQTLVRYGYPSDVISRHLSGE